MQALIRFFVELCLLRRAPQDLPASDMLFRLMLILDLLIGVLAGVAAGLSAGSSLIQGAVEVALMLGALYLALYLSRHPGRFIQSATALLGSGALIGLLAVVPLSLNPTGSDQTDAATIGAIMLLALMIWNIVVNGHILRHSFGITLAQGAAAATAFQILAIALMGILFGAG